MKRVKLIAALLALSLFVSGCMIPVFPVFSGQPAPQEGAGSDGAALRAAAVELAQAVIARDYATLDSLIGEQFRLGLWQSEGRVLDPEEALAELEEIYVGPAADITFDTVSDVRDLLGEDYLALWGPDVTVLDVLYARGLGEEGTAEAMLALGKEDFAGESPLVWLGMLVAPTGFVPSEQAGAPAIITGLNILRTTPIYPQPSLETDSVGLLRPGQTVEVLALDEGGFWRIPCPVSVAAECWVADDPEFVEAVGGGMQLPTPTKPPAQEPTATPLPPAEPERITLAENQITVVRQGNATPERPAEYVLRVSAGQAMTVDLLSADDVANFAVTGAANGQPYKRIVDESRLWTFTVPVTQDYIITVQSVDRADFTLTVVVPPAPPQPPATATSRPTAVPTLAAQEPERIRFLAGETSAQRTDTVRPDLARQYLVNVQAGQSVTVQIISGGNEATFGISGVSDRQRYKGAEVAAESFTFVSPIRQDYLITVLTGVATNYTLTVVVPPLEVATPLPPPPVQPLRLSVPAGETGTSRTTIVDAYATDVYLVRAVAGQTMQVQVSSPESIVNIGVSGYNSGVVLKSLANPARAWSGVLPSSQDYLIVVENPRGVRVRYTLTVDFSPLEPGPNPTATPRPSTTSERIRFQPGAISAIVDGNSDGSTIRSYVLAAQGGQTMSVELYAAGAASFSVVGADGNVLKSSGAGDEFWSGELPTTQDYIIAVVPEGGPIEFTLVVTVVF